MAFIANTPLARMLIISISKHRTTEVKRILCALLLTCAFAEYRQKNALFVATLPYPPGVRQCRKAAEAAASKQASKVALLAFTEWIEEHNLPLESELLEAYGVEICLLDDEEKDALKQHDSYPATVSLFTNLGIVKNL